ncbi:hypothetical protein [Bradyrhizobium algeriense]|uniref:hypothetical protein n=1 Tax=Bradyrhizobium algeriense TaxID=634784 RepID=UPI001930FB2B|nr:hypothetical protein [Bradyrhizobium algeriense]
MGAGNSVAIETNAGAGIGDTHSSQTREREHWPIVLKSIFWTLKRKAAATLFCVRYELNGQTFIHVVDGGYQSTGEKVVNFIDKYYGNPKRIDHVVATRNDGDHAGGLQRVLEDFEVGALWMLRPWIYSKELLPRFKRFTTADGLEKALKEAYSNLAALEEIAIRRKVQIYEPFQGASIGAFRVMAPTRSRFLDLVISSEKTPEEKGLLETARDAVVHVMKEALCLLGRLGATKIFRQVKQATKTR